MFYFFGNASGTWYREWILERIPYGIGLQNMPEAPIKNIGGICHISKPCKSTNRCSNSAIQFESATICIYAEILLLTIFCSMMMPKCYYLLYSGASWYGNALVCYVSEHHDMNSYGKIGFATAQGSSHTRPYCPTEGNTSGSAWRGAPPPAPPAAAFSTDS